MTNTPLLSSSNSTSPAMQVGDAVSGSLILPPPKKVTFHALGEEKLLASQCW